VFSQWGLRPGLWRWLGFHFIGVPASRELRDVLDARDVLVSYGSVVVYYVRVLAGRDLRLPSQGGPHASSLCCLCSCVFPGERICMCASVGGGLVAGNKM
jgi:hypothetical protein